jgi:hypothetical protein
MKIIPGNQEVPVIYTAHHASHDFHEFAERSNLTEEEVMRFSDYGTAETVPTNGIVSIVAEHSRALSDLNRDPDDPGRFQDADYHKPDRHPIWLPGQALTATDKVACQARFYTPFHDEITKRLAARDSPTYIIAWDNTAHYDIGQNEAGETVVMKPFILSNRGAEGHADSPNEQTSCDPEFLQQLAENFAITLGQYALPNEIHLNLVMKGGYICRTYSTLRNPELLQNLGVKAQVQDNRSAHSFFSCYSQYHR